MSNIIQSLGPADSFTDSRDQTQLFAGACEPFTRPVLLKEGYDFKRGMVIFAADQDAEFTPARNGTLPGVNDVVGVVSEDIDLTDEADACKHVMYIAPADFAYDALGLASTDDLTAADWKSIIEVMIAKGMNVRRVAYGDFAPAV